MRIALSPDFFQTFLSMLDMLRRGGGECKEGKEKVFPSQPTRGPEGKRISLVKRHRMPLVEMFQAQATVCVSLLWLGLGRGRRFGPLLNTPLSSSEHHWLTAVAVNVRYCIQVVCLSSKR